MLAGILPDLAADLQVSIPRAGLLISGFALGMMLGAPILALATLRWPKRRALLVFTAIFAGGAIRGARYSAPMQAQIDTEVFDAVDRLDELIAAEAARGFDLVREIPFRIRILRDREGYVVVTVLAVLVLAGDIVTKSLLPVPLPVGIATSALGGIFLLYLLVSTNRKATV